MPLFYQQDINQATRLAIWKIEETEHFFLQKAPLSREITHPNKRLQHLAGRYLLHSLFPDFPYSELLIANTRKPYLPNEQYHFSIAHCGNYAAAIVSNKQRVGIDIEQPTQKVLNIRQKFLHKEEMDWFGLEKSLDIHLNTILWAAKEAMYKWWGNLGVDFSEMLRLKEFQLSKNGLLEAYINLEKKIIPLELHYLQMEEIVLVWIANDFNNNSSTI